MKQEIKALLERTSEILMFSDYELAIWREDLMYRELAKKFKRTNTIKPRLQLPSKTIQPH